MDFTDDQIERYSRQIILKEIGGEGQKKLLKAKAVIIGAGGLGSPAAFYLAAAGIGTIGLVDQDRVDTSNLQRQILHSTEDVGTFKTESARKKLLSLNPDCNIVMHTTRITTTNALNIISNYDLVINGCDNFPTRYLTISLKQLYTAYAKARNSLALKDRQIKNAHGKPPDNKLVTNQGRNY